MIKDTLAEIVNERIRICEKTDDNWGDGIEECWEKYVEIITADIEKGIAYFLHECTDEGFYWLAEAFEDISEKAQSEDLIIAWRSRLAAVAPENYQQQSFKSEHMRKWVDYNEYVRSIEKEIDYAENRIDK